MKQDSALKRKGILMHATTWMSVNDVVLSGISRSQRKSNVVGVHTQEVPGVVQLTKMKQDDGHQGLGRGVGRCRSAGTEVRLGRGRGVWGRVELVVAQQGEPTAAAKLHT